MPTRKVYKEYLPLAEKLKQLRTEKGLTQQQVAEQMGMPSQSSYENFESASRKATLSMLRAFAKFFDVSVDYLAGTTDQRKLEIKMSNIFPIDTKKFPLLGEIACGEPIYTQEDFESYIEAGADVKADFCLRCNGDSMVNARINDGDIVFIRKQSMVNNGEIAAVIIDDEATLKRVEYFPERNLLLLKAENPKFETLTYANEELDKIRIIGKAVVSQIKVM